MCVEAIIEEGTKRRFNRTNGKSGNYGGGGGGRQVSGTAQVLGRERGKEKLDRKIDY